VGVGVPPPPRVLRGEITQPEITKKRTSEAAQSHPQIKLLLNPNTRSIIRS